MHPPPWGMSRKRSVFAIRLIMAFSTGRSLPVTTGSPDAYSASVPSNRSYNWTNATDTYGRNEDLAKLEVAVQGIILFLAIFGNGTVLFVLFTRRKKLSRMNMMIVHLSLADLFVAFFNVLPQMAWDVTFRFVGGDFLCRSVKYFQVVAMYASSSVLIMTAVDRYLAICHPLTAHTWTHRKMHMLVILAWVFSLVFAIPQVVIFSYSEIDPGSGVYDCWGQFHPDWTLKLYITWFTLAIYILPFLILLIAYGRICYVVWRCMRGREPSKVSKSKDIRLGYKDSDRQENGSLLGASGADSSGKCKTVSGTINPRAHVKGVSKAKVKTVKLTLTVIACYLLCWGPFFVAQMWSAWDPAAPFTSKALLTGQLG